MLFLPLVWFATAAPPVASAPVRAITTVRQVRALTADEARAAITVHLRGVVTVPSPYKSSFFFRDASAGISIDQADGASQPKAGQRVEVDGETAAGLFAPIVVAHSVRVTGTEKLPEPRIYEFNKLIGGGQDSQWISLRGLVRSASIRPLWGRPVLVLNLDMGVGAPIPVQVYELPQTGWQHLPGAIVRLRGVCGTVFNDKRQFVGLRFFISGLDDINVEQPAPEDPFDAPLRSIDSLLLFGAGGESTERVKVRGTVTWTKGGQGLYLQEGRHGIFVKSGQATSIAVGSEAEVVGYPAPASASPILEDAVYRPAGGSGTVRPIPVSSAATVVAHSGGFTTAPYDSLLVQLKGRVVQEILGSEEDQLILRDGAAIFSAKIPRLSRPARAFEPGALLQLTGVCAARIGELPETRSFEVLLRSADDVIVVENAPWWNAGRAGWAVAVVLLASLISGAVLIFVRRQSQLHSMAMTDPLTGLYNRRGFLQLAGHDWDVARRRNLTLLLFYIDVDRLKEINDSLGHRIGDQALISMAQTLRHCFRTSDVIARLGGDEFAVACDASADSPERIIDRLESAIEARNREEKRPYVISASIGALVCDASVGELSLEELTTQADGLMYEKKRARRDAETHGFSIAR